MVHFREAGVVAGCVLMLGLVVGPVLAGDSTSPVYLARAFVPSAQNVHGETLVLKHKDGGCCVRTILHSPSFRRGVREIMAREASLWPEHKKGYEDSQRYLKALEQTKQLVVAEPRSADQSGLPYTMLMDFVFQPGHSFVELSNASVAREADGFTILSNAPIMRIEVSDEYMSRAMLVMTATALGPDRHDAAEVLSNAGWLDLSESIDPAAPAPVR